MRGGEFLGGAGERQAEEVSREVSDLSQNPKIKELAASSEHKAISNNINKQYKEPKAD